MSETNTPFSRTGDTAPPYVDNRLLLVAGKSEVREYNYVLNDAEIGLFSNEAVINCAP